MRQGETPKIALLTALTVLATYGVTSFGQADEPVARATWGAPQSGNPVVRYVGELESWPTAGGDTIRVDFGTAGTETEYDFTYGYGHSFRMRVAGVDSAGRTGVWSEWSNTWADAGPPSAPFLPRIGLAMVER